MPLSGDAAASVTVTVTITVARPMSHWHSRNSDGPAGAR
jgi:hypothetical protein